MAPGSGGGAAAGGGALRGRDKAAMRPLVAGVKAALAACIGAAVQVRGAGEGGERPSVEGQGAL